MPTRHLFPCPQCEAQIPVEPGQAGETISCSSCQTEIELPSLRDIKQLPMDPVPTEQKKPKREWSILHGLMFSGGLAAAILGSAAGAIFLIVYFQLEIDDRPDDPQAFEDKVDNWTVEQQLQFWESEIVAQPLPEWRESPIRVNRRFQKVFMGMAIVSLIIAVVGIGCIVGSFVMKDPARNRKRRPTKK